MKKIILFVLSLVIGAGTIAYAGVYNVQKGDTVNKIANKLNVSFFDITGYKSGNPNLIYVGENLDIVAGGPMIGVTPALPVNQGGTGRTTFTAGQCLIGNGTGGLTSAPCGSGGGGGSSLLLEDPITNAFYVSTTTAQWQFGRNSTTTTDLIDVAGRLTVEDRLTTGYLRSTSTATSTFNGGVYSSLFSAPYFHATSTTASSTFANGINLQGGCFSINGNCIGTNTGTVTSVDMSVPTGLTISGNPITTSGTLALTLTSGYIIPTQANINTALENFSTTSADYWLPKNPLIIGSINSTSTATSSFSGGLYSSLVSAPYFHATSSTATTTLNGGLSVGQSIKTNYATGCIQTDSNGFFYSTGVACGTGTGDSFSTTSADYWLPKNPFEAGSFVASSTATSSFRGDLYTRLLMAPSISATSTTATSTFSGGMIALGGIKSNLVCNGLSNGGLITTDANGNLVCGDDDSNVGGTGASYDWLQENDSFAVNSLTPTTTIPIHLKGTATSTSDAGFQVNGLAGGNYVMGNLGQFSVVQATSTIATSTFSGDVLIGSSGGKNALAITAGHVHPASISTGGLVNITNTLNSGAGLIVYTNHAGSAAGRLANFNCGNAAFDQDCVHIDNTGTLDGLSITGGANGSNAASFTNSGLGHTLNVAYTGSSVNIGAASFSSTNAYTTVNISGVETGQGTLKIAHTGTGSDGSASAISIDLAGSGTAAQGIFMDATGGGTTGKLLNLRNNGIELLTLDANGRLGIGSTTPGVPLSVTGSGVITGLLTIPYINATSTIATSTFAGGVTIRGGLKLENLTGTTNCAQFDTNGNLTMASGACGVAGGEANTASSLGTGLNLFDSKSGVDLRFNTLEAGSNITLATTTNANTIVISATGGAATTTLYRDNNTYDGVTTFTNALITQELDLATTTSMTINFASSTKQLMRISSSNIAVTFTGAVAGQHLSLSVCNPAAGLIGSTTFNGVIWDGHVNPGSNTQNNWCDVFGFDASQATSTTASSPVIYGYLMNSY